jgi:hypothetical protein
MRGIVTKFSGMLEVFLHLDCELCYKVRPRIDRLLLGKKITHTSSRLLGAFGMTQWLVYGMCGRQTQTHKESSTWHKLQCVNC